MRLKTVYFAHPRLTYDTQAELDVINDLRARGLTVINPNQESHQEACQGKGIDYFLDLVVRCDALVFFPTQRDGVITWGVSKEVDHAWRRHMPVFLAIQYGDNWRYVRVSAQLKAFPVLTVEDTHNRLRAEGHDDRIAEGEADED